MRPSNVTPQTRWRRPFACTVAAVVAGFVAWLIGFDVLHLEEHRGFHAVRLGKSEAKVRETLGKPPGQYGQPGARYGNHMWDG